MITISESGMDFGPFESDHCFEIEKCPAYMRIKDGVKIAEFVWLRDDLNPPKIWIVEAKSSSPQPDPPEKFQEWINDIRDKLVNALCMMFSACLNRSGSAYNDIPDPFRHLTLSTLDARLILVINGHKQEWLPPLTDALSLALRATVNTWGLTTPAVMVLNDEMARRHNLIR